MGLSGSMYIDKVDGFKEKREEDENITISTASIASGGYVDRIYKSAPRQLFLADTGIKSVYEISQSESYMETVVFNPWETGKKGPQHPDFDDDGFNYMICVEAAAVINPVELLAGGVWHGDQLISIAPLSD
jgi:glucose-6-phosphate 1-epimerase